MKVYVSRFEKFGTYSLVQYVDLILNKEEAKHLGYPETKVGFAPTGSGNFRVFRTENPTGHKTPGTGSSIRHRHGEEHSVRFSLAKETYRPTGRIQTPTDKTEDGFVVRISETEPVPIQKHPPRKVKVKTVKDVKDVKDVLLTSHHNPSNSSELENLKAAIELVKSTAKELNATLFIDETGELRARIETVI